MDQIIQNSQVPERARVLIVDDDELVLATMQRQLSRHFDCQTVSDSRQALVIVAEGGIDVIVSDLSMPYLSGDRLLAQVYECWPEVERLLITGHADISSVMRAVNQGKIFSYLVKPWATLELIEAVEGAYQRGLAVRQLKVAYKQACAELDNRPAAQPAIRRGLVAKSADPRQTLIRQRSNGE
jgi:DNA-binding NtrC family response regulator